MARSKKPGMPLQVYEQLWELHAGFDQVRHEEAETNEAGRLFRLRVARERKEE